MSEQTNQVQQPASETPPPKRKVSPEDSLVESLMSKYETQESTSKPTTSEAATRTDNNDRDPMTDTLEAANKARKEKGEESAVEEDVVPEEEDVAEETEEPQEDTEEDGDVTEDDGEADEESVDPDDEVVYTTDDGEEVTLRELKRGFLREADYTRKTQEVAAERQKLQEMAQAAQQHQQVVAQHLSMSLDILEPALAELAQTDWDNLAANDPYQYAEKRALFDQAQVRYQRLRQAAEQQVQQAQAQQQYAKQQYLAAEQKKLIMALPELGDAKKGQQLARSIRDYALKAGLSNEEASRITDHRLVVMLNKARMFDELSESKLSAAKKKVSKAPTKATRSGSPPSKSDRQRETRAAQKAKLKQSGRAEDLVAMLLR